MRIQQTDQILKEARYSRHDHAMHVRERAGLWTRVWRSLTRIFRRS